MKAEYNRAVELQALLENHSVTLPVDMQQAQIALARLRPNLSAEDFVVAYERGKAFDLDMVVAELLYNT
jgi:hypothetical protein